MNLRLTTLSEFKAVWDALNQFIDNQDDSVEEYELPAADRAKLEAARRLRSKLDSVIINVGR